MYSYQQKPTRKVIQRCNIAANRIIGQTAEQIAENQILDLGWNIHEVHPMVRPNSAPGTPANYYFYPDFLCVNGHGTICFVEVKSSMTAPFTHRQITGYPAIAQYGGTVINPTSTIVNIPVGTPTYEIRGD